MERFIEVIAPVGRRDFMAKFLFFLFLCGALNHLRHLLSYGFSSDKSFWDSFVTASFTAVPMCYLSLLLIGHLNVLQKTLYQQATCDALTGLPNRRWFMTNTPDTLKPGQAILLIDLDHFKDINDTFGHDVGDECLKQTAVHLNAVLGGVATPARIGGEEFAAFIPNTQNTDIDAIAARISEGFVFNVNERRTHKVTASAGIHVAVQEQKINKSLVEADHAVYRAKNAGRACFAKSQLASAA